MKDLIINIAKDFTRTPGVRAPEEGLSSGEEFLGRLLYPKFSEAVKQGVNLIVELDGTAGYATSFLEAAFGGLVRGEPKFRIPPTKLSLVRKHLILRSLTDRFLVEEIMEYIEEANGALA